MVRSRLLFLMLFICSLCANGYAGALWLPVPAPAAKATSPATARAYTYYQASETAVRQALLKPANGLIELPLANGSFMTFRLVASPVLPAAMAQKYPNINTYTAISTTKPGITAKVDYTLYGMHAMVYDGDNTCLIDPATPTATGLYRVHYKRDETRAEHGCATMEGAAKQATARYAARIEHGYVLRTYRLALSCNHHYARAVTGKPNPTKEEVLSKMVTTLNRVNGIYEREVAVSMVLAENADTIVFVEEAGDPLGPINENASALLDMNQKVCDTLIGDANYDIGHVLTTSEAGGLSQVGIVCKTGFKAQCVTGNTAPFGDGYDVDYVAHEMGHEYGADHTFNNSSIGGCTGNAVALRAFEPGSGSTIMAYAGLCAGDNLQMNSDDYFHAATLDQIRYYITLPTGGDGCALKTPTGNKLPAPPFYSATYEIPTRTPFELSAPTVTDSTGNAEITYCWEQWNLGDFGRTLANTSKSGPLFRSYRPTTDTTRLFPNLNMIRAGLTSNAGVDGASGEKLPTEDRFLSFRLTTRSLLSGKGSFYFSDDSIRINVHNKGATGFVVTTQNTAGIVYQGYAEVPVNWNVAGTTAAPINADRVDIYLSADGGRTWPFFLGTYPNSGSAKVKMPNTDTTISAARLKVKAHDNIFFNLNLRDFSVVKNFEKAISVYPNPVSNTLHILLDGTGLLEMAAYDVTGRKIAGAQLSEADNQVDVTYWARGLYLIKLVDANGNTSLRRVVVQ